MNTTLVYDKYGKAGCYNTKGELVTPWFPSCEGAIIDLCEGYITRYFATEGILFDVCLRCTFPSDSGDNFVFIQPVNYLKEREEKIKVGVGGLWCATETIELPGTLKRDEVILGEDFFYTEAEAIAAVQSLYKKQVNEISREIYHIQNNLAWAEKSLKLIKEKESQKLKITKYTDL